MSWSLTALVDPARREDLLAYLAAWVDAFGDGIAEAEFCGGPGDHRTHREVIRGAFQVREALAERVKEHVRGDGRLAVGLRLNVEGSPPTWPHPEAVAYGPRHAGPSWTGRSVPLLLDFGNRSAYREGVQLVGGVKLDDAFVRRTVEAWCRALRPRTLILEEEQATGFELNALLVYHRDLSGFEEDLRKCLATASRRSAADPKATPPADALVHDRMTRAGRHPDRWRALVDFLVAHAPTLLDPARPWSLGREDMEQALLESDALDFFVDGDGVGVAGVPFLAESCEDPFLSLIENTGQRLETPVTTARTTGEGRFLVDEPEFGDPERGCGSGRDAILGGPVLVTVGGRQERSAASLRASLAPDVPGIARLLHLGPVDDAPDGGLWAMVEARPAGVSMGKGCGAPMGTRRALRLIAQVGAILQAAHLHGLPVVGLRPELIFASPDGDVAGIAPRCEPFLWTARPPCHGQAPPFWQLYMAPEVLALRPADVQCDVFSLCAVGAFWVTGVHPFGDGSPSDHLMAIMSGVPRIALPQPWDGLLGPGLARQPSDRPRLDRLLLQVERLARAT